MNLEGIIQRAISPHKGKRKYHALIKIIANLSGKLQKRLVDIQKIEEMGIDSYDI